MKVKCTSAYGPVIVQALLEHGLSPEVDPGQVLDVPDDLGHALCENPDHFTPDVPLLLAAPPTADPAEPAASPTE